MYLRISFRLPFRFTAPKLFILDPKRNKAGAPGTLFIAFAVIFYAFLSKNAFGPDYPPHSPCGAAPAGLASPCPRGAEGHLWAGPRWGGALWWPRGRTAVRGLLRVHCPLTAAPHFSSRSLFSSGYKDGLELSLDMLRGELRASLHGPPPHCFSGVSPVPGCRGRGSASCPPPLRTHLSPAQQSLHLDGLLDPLCLLKEPTPPLQAPSELL